MTACVAVAGACGGPSDSSREDGGATTLAPAPSVSPLTIPVIGALAPSQVRVVRADDRGGTLLADVDGCDGCHADVAASWRESAHAFASFNNPIYRTSVDRLRKERGKDASRFCGGCHDASLLIDGAMANEIEADDLRAHAGVSCRVCHGITGTRPDGNGSYDLDATAIPVPKPGDEASLREHKARVKTKTTTSADLCASCHRAYLDEGSGNARHLIGQDDATPWARSPYAKSHAARIDRATVTEARCQDCHMPKIPAEQGDQAAKDGVVRSHRFSGGHTWLAEMIGSSTAKRLAEEELKSAVHLDVPFVRTPRGLIAVARDAIPVSPGDDVSFAVVVKNDGAGHRFPGGVMDAQDTWLEVTLEDSRSRVWLGTPTSDEAHVGDLDVHRFASFMADENGKQRLGRETHLFRAGVFNHTIAPRDASVVEYAFHLPTPSEDGLAAAAFTAGAATIRVRLLHRTRNLKEQADACEDSKSARGKAFNRAGLKRVARALDACAPQPVTELGRAAFVLGAGHAASDAPQSFARCFDHALGMTHAVQERLDEAIASVDCALVHAITDEERAMARSLRADVFAKQGRGAEARSEADRAEPFALGHAALERVRGESYLPSWQWAEAATHFERVVADSPKDDAAFVALATARGGAGDRRGALDAASRGLLVQPRDADLLRIQSIAADDVGAGDEDTRAKAHAAFLERRSPDDAPKTRALCSKAVPGCARERLSVHTHTLVPRH